MSTNDQIKAELQRLVDRWQAHQSVSPGRALPTADDRRAVLRHSRRGYVARGGELDGVRLLSPERIHVAAEVQNDEIDFLFKVRARRSMGYRLGSDAGPGGGQKAFGHVGGGGSFGYADPDRHFAIALAKNYLCRPSVGNSPVFVPEEGPRRVYESVAEALGILR